MRPASLISSKMIEREVNQDSDTWFTIRLIESTRNSLPARGLRFPNLDRFNRPIVFRLNATNGPVLPAGRIYTKQGIVSPFDFDSLFEPGPPRGSTTPTFEIVFAFVDGDVHDRGSFEQWRGWRERLGHCWVARYYYPPFRLLDPVQSIINAG